MFNVDKIEDKGHVWCLWLGDGKLTKGSTWRVRCNHILCVISFVTVHNSISTLPFEDNSRKTVQLMVNFLSYSLSAVERIYADERHHQLMACKDWLPSLFLLSVGTFRIKNCPGETVSKTHVISRPSFIRQYLNLSEKPEWFQVLWIFAFDFVTTRWHIAWKNWIMSFFC